MLEGVEIYKARPIFYGLGGLFFDRDGRRGHETPGGFIPFLSEQFEGVFPVVTYKDGCASVICLYPIVMSDQAAGSRGQPHLAQGGQSQRILQRLKAMSEPFGTTIQIVGAKGSYPSPEPPKLTRGRKRRASA